MYLVLQQLMHTKNWWSRSASDNVTLRSGILNENWSSRMIIIFLFIKILEFKSMTNVNVILMEYGSSIGQFSIICKTEFLKKVL